MKELTLALIAGFFIHGTPGQSKPPKASNQEQTQTVRTPGKEADKPVESQQAKTTQKGTSSKYR